MGIRPIIFASLLLCLGVLLYLKNFAVPDMPGYRELVEKGVSTVNIGTDKSPYLFQQHRNAVSKDIWTNHKGERMHLQLTSAHSHLALERDDIVEKMDEVVCLMQEEIYYVLSDGREAVRHPSGNWILRNGDPADEKAWILEKDLKFEPMQIVRYMESDRADYHYKNDRFIAEQARIKRFKIQGHQLPQSIEGLEPTMEGTAQTVELSLLGPEIKLKAHKLKATLFSLGGDA